MRISDWSSDVCSSDLLENRQQAADQVSISNSIGSLRLLAMTDWREFVEAMSVVEKTLRDEPGATYGRMDFATRDRYRHVVERLARRGKIGRAHVCTPVTNAHLVCSLLITNNNMTTIDYYA